MRRSLATLFLQLLFRRLDHETGPLFFLEWSSNKLTTHESWAFSHSGKKYTLHLVHMHCRRFSISCCYVSLTRALERSLGSLLIQNPLSRDYACGGGGESSQQARALAASPAWPGAGRIVGYLEKASNETPGFPEGGE